MELKTIIEAAWENRALLSETATRNAIDTVIEALDKGQMRVAQPESDGTWTVNEWIKKAVVMYFPIRTMETMEVGPFEFHDKMALKRDYAGLGVRVVPGASARHGAFLASGVLPVAQADKPKIAVSKTINDKGLVIFTPGNSAAKISTNDEYSK